MSDRRSIAHLEMGREQALESERLAFDTPVSSFVNEILATRGDRLALSRTLWRGAGRTVGPSEVEFLEVGEVDERGQFVASVMFDPADLDAAYAELDARFAAGEGANRRNAGVTFLEAVAAREWDVALGALAPDFVATDHRLLGMGTIHGPGKYVETIQSLVGLAPDARWRTDHMVRSSRGGVLVAGEWVGTWHGGAFERAGISVVELDVLGRMRRFDFYDLEQLEEARARFAAIRFDPLRIPANVATVALDRYVECIAKRDWDGLRELYAPDLAWEDRRRLLGMAGGLDQAIANARLLAESRISYTPLAIAGERLALVRILYTGERDGGAFEIETLELEEVDAEGRFVASITFDPDDRRAASAELLERLTPGEGRRAVPLPLIEFARAHTARDLDRVRAVLPDDFFWDDQRRTGPGRLDRDRYVAWLASLFEQSPDAIVEPMYVIAARASRRSATRARNDSLPDPPDVITVITWSRRS